MSRSALSPSTQSRNVLDASSTERQMEQNVGTDERAVSIAAGSILAALGLSRRSLPGVLIAAVGGGLIYRGATGHCPVYAAMGMDTTQSDDPDAVERETHEHGIHVEQAYLISRSAEDLYQYWRNFENLPRIMTHLESVRVSDEKHSHWVAKAPRIVGGSVEWDAEITRDEKNTAIAWRSLPGSQIDTAGEIRFTPALGDRGTEVHVYMDYVPPAGKLGHWIATLFGLAPRRQMQEDLRNFKRIMEVGELPTIVGQSHGTCTGQGEIYTE
jgi:uncharacterized membrane protein